LGESNDKKLLNDLQNKYFHEYKTEVSYFEVLRTLQVTEIPETYKKLLPDDIPLPSYDPRYDCITSQFDAEYSLNNRTIIVAVSDDTVYDNLSKVKSLVSVLGSSISMNSNPNIVEENHQKRSRSEIDSLQKNQKPKHILHEIASNSIFSTTSIVKQTNNNSSMNITSSENLSLLDSPFCLIYQMMLEKSRSKILIRRHPG
jgi:hypothetical protein